MTRYEWCMALAKLVSPSFPESANTALLDMLPALHHMGDNLFTPASLIHVAGNSSRQTVPSFREITVGLNEYRAAFVYEKPVVTKLPREADRPEPSESERAYVTGLLEGHRAELLERDLADLAARPKPGTMPDVTLKGEALAALRRLRGVVPIVRPPTPPESGLPW